MAAGTFRFPRLAKERLREQPGERFFAAAARAAEKIGMRKTPGARRAQKMPDLRAVALKSLDFQTASNAFPARKDPKAAEDSRPPPFPFRS